MVQSTTAHELIPALIRSLLLVDAAEEDQAELTYWRLRVRNTLRFLQDLLGDKPYFAGEQLTLAEIMAGTLVYRAPEVGILLSDYPKLNQWSERLVTRPSWQQIELSAEEWSNFKRQIRVLPKLWERQRRQRLAVLSSSITA